MQTGVNNIHKGLGKELTCTRCGKTFARPATLNSHMELHTGQFKYFCEICRKGYNNNTPYVVHMRKHEGLRYQCDVCSKTFGKKQNLDHHKSIHTGIYRFKCEICSKGFNDKAPYEKHVMSHDN